MQPYWEYTIRIDEDTALRLLKAGERPVYRDDDRVNIARLDIDAPQSVRYLIWAESARADNHLHTRTLGRAVLIAKLLSMYGTGWREEYRRRRRMGELQRLPRSEE